MATTDLETSSLIFSTVSTAGRGTFSENIALE